MRQVSQLETAYPSRALHVARPRNRAKKFGIRYERKVQFDFSNLFGPTFRASEWFRYRDANGVGACCMDGVLTLKDRYCIFEMKTTHTSDAWWQLNGLYRPVADYIFYDKRAKLCEVTRIVDTQSVKWPVPFELLLNLTDFFRWLAEDHQTPGVLVWK